MSMDSDETNRLLNQVHEMIRGSVVEEIVRAIKEDGDKTRALLALYFGPPDVAGFNVSFKRPNRQGRTKDMANVMKLGSPGAISVLDDAPAEMMVLAPVDGSGDATQLNPQQPVPSYSVTPGTAVKLRSPNPDATGLTQAFDMVKGQAAIETITGTYTNADGTVVTAVGTVTVTLDPAELDVGGFNVSFVPLASKKP